MKALLFGSIGTVCETSDLQRHGFNQAFDEHALDWYWSEDEYRRLLAVTGGRERIRAYAREKAGLELVESTVVRIHDRATEVFNELLHGGGSLLRSGVGRLIEDAKEGRLRIGLATPTEHANLAAIEKALGGSFSLGDFEIATDRQSIDLEKPSPAIHAHALRALGVEEGDAIAVEDTQACVAAAVTAGVACLATPYHYGAGKNFDPITGAEVIDGDSAVLVDGMVTLDSLSAVLDGQTANA